MAPPGSTECALLLAKASNEEQKKNVGYQAGGRVFLFLHTDDFNRDHERYTKNNIKFIRGPVKEVYGTVAVFEDLYGNLWDLIEPTKKYK